MASRRRLLWALCGGGVWRFGLQVVPSVLCLFWALLLPCVFVYASLGLWHRFGLCFASFGISLASLWDRFRIVVGSFTHRCGIMFDSVCLDIVKGLG